MKVRIQETANRHATEVTKKRGQETPHVEDISARYRNSAPEEISLNCECNTNC